jgi:hypothetical protein
MLDVLYISVICTNIKRKDRSGHSEFSILISYFVVQFKLSLLTD